MYAVYCYQAGSTATNVLADMVKLLTGETNKANLSSDCVQANTSIISTVSAGWTVHDSAVGSGSQVIKCLQADGTTMKYYRLMNNDSTSYRGIAYESWNATTHTGTNPTGDANGFMTGSWSLINGGYFYIYASPRTIFMRPYHTAAWQTTGTGAYLEFTRETDPTGYPTSIVASNGSSTPVGYNWICPRVKMPNSAGDYASVSNGHFTHVVGIAAGSNLADSNAAFCRNAAEATQVIAYKLEARRTTATYSLLGAHRCGEIYDILGVAGSLGTNLDEITISGKTYVLHHVVGGGTPTMLIPKE